MYFGINKIIQTIKPGNTLILFIVVLPVLLILLSINCSNNDTDELLNKIHFPVGKTHQKETITDIFKDTLLIEDGYLTVNEYVIIWPQGYSYRETNNTTEIINSVGAVVTSVGNDILVTGMEIDISEMGSITDFVFPVIILNRSRFLAVVSINEPLPEVHFPTNKKACDVITLGMANGTLTIENGYLIVMDRVIIWPYGFTINYKDNAISVIDEEGNVVGKVGNYIGLAGAGINHFTADSITDYVFPDNYMSYDFFDAQDVIE